MGATHVANACAHPALALAGALPCDVAVPLGVVELQDSNEIEPGVVGVLFLGLLGAAYPFDLHGVLGSGRGADELEGDPLELQRGGLSPVVRGCVLANQWAEDFYDIRLHVALADSHSGDISLRVNFGRVRPNSAQN